LLNIEISYVDIDFLALEPSEKVARLTRKLSPLNALKAFEVAARASDFVPAATGNVTPKSQPSRLGPLAGSIETHDMSLFISRDRLGFVLKSSDSA
jgi:hypothetical protein